MMDNGGASTLEVGAEAPSLSLRSVDGSEVTDLQSFRGKKPVVLIFGSYS